ncbi:MAG: gas vesicle protein K [Candidatus Thermoplasmatota archaeon]
MAVNVDEKNLKQGLLGLVVTLVEIIKEALEHQALRRMESGRLNEEEVERLGNALMELNEAIEKIKNENSLEDTVSSIRNGLDKVVDDIIGR